MLSRRQRRAIKLMFQKPDLEVAAEVGVRPETLIKWRATLEFSQALSAEDKTIRDAAARIASDASLEAAKKLHKMLSDKDDGKLSLDTLKAAGAFEGREEAAGEALENIIREVAAGDDTES